MIERSIEHELDGKSQVDFRPDGICCELLLPHSRDNFQEISGGGLAAD